MHNVLLYLIECVQKLISLADQPRQWPAQPMVLVLNQLAVSHNHIFVFWRTSWQRIICFDKFY